MTGPSPTDLALGRRERKRLATRAALLRAAIELFGERGYDAVTVGDVAEAVDLDPSTFFRHFGSKEAVLFTDVVDFVGLIKPTLLAQPPEEPIVEAMTGTTADLLRQSPFDLHQELLRARLMQESSTLHAQVLVYRQALVDEWAGAIAQRTGADLASDAEPSVLAHAWVTASDVVRHRVVTGEVRPAGSARAVAESIRAVAADGVRALHGVER
jgi:AcrR family transcriptional regulator